LVWVGVDGADDEEDDEDGDVGRAAAGDGDDDEEEEEEDEAAAAGKDPHLAYRALRHDGAVNRVRAMPQSTATATHLAATWADTGKVHVWDLSAAVSELDGRTSGPWIARLHEHTPHPRLNAGRGWGCAGTAGPFSTYTAPLFTFGGHSTEGFALDWSPTVTGRCVRGRQADRGDADHGHTCARARGLAAAAAAALGF
jgi:ribosome assembly protein RRB1